MSQPINNREQFFKLVEQSLQQYFDTCDRYWGGILHLTVGVKVGKVGGIIESADAFGASVATTEGLSSQRSLPPPRLSYEGFTLHRIETILRYVLPKYVSRPEVGFAVGNILDELRMERPPLIARKRDSLVLINQQSSQPTLLSRRPKEGDSESAEAEPKPKKPRTRGRKRTIDN